MPPRDDILAKINPRFLPQVHAQLAAQRSRLAPGLAAVAQREALPTERRVRQSRQKLNKLELAYQDMLRVEFRGETVLAQSVRLWLANGDWYKPDFYVPTRQLYIEVKGPRAFRGGFEFLKVAAAQHPWATFRLVWKKNGEWLTQTILTAENRA